MREICALISQPVNPPDLKYHAVSPDNAPNIIKDRTGTSFLPREIPGIHTAKSNEGTTIARNAAREKMKAGITVTMGNGQMSVGMGDHRNPK